MKVFLILTALLSSFCGFSQDINYDEFYKTIEKRVFYHEHAKLLDEINVVLANNPDGYSTSEIENLKVLKVQALVDANLLDEGLALSNEMLSENHLTPYHLTSLLIQRALIYEILEEFRKSFDDLSSAKVYIDKDQRIKTKYYATWLIRMSSWYRVQDKKEQSYHLALKAKEFAEAQHNLSKSSEAGILLAFYHSDHENYDEAIALNNKAIAVGKALNNKISVTYLYLNLSGIYKKLDQERISNIYIDSAFNHIKNTDYLEIKSASYKMKSEASKARQLLDSALYYYKTAVDYEKAHNFNLKTIKINEQTLDFELKKEQIEKEKVITENKTLYKNLLLIFIIALVLLAFLIQEIKRKKQTDRQKLIIEKEALKLEQTVKDKTFLIHEINHRIKNNLAVILSLIEIQGQESNKTTDEQIKQLHDRVNTIALGHQLFSYDLDTAEKSFVNMETYAKTVFETKRSATTKPFSYYIEASKVELMVDIALPFGLVLNELITNSIKHAKPNNAKILELNLNISLQDQNIQVIYKDNGAEFPTPQNSEAMGLYIVEGMLNQISATYTRELSTFFITIPYAKNS
ncbi:sensor histidine kinase [Winogradskyella arenosi]|uniref:histidine kinase n=1 Tax=Winogradskyella arenosi TaxID=533325 RepID=A0A368ZKK0_9FLAO|nr:sensor histidine kinase [Winogradskyella arenosi]RCW92818.1 two-component sensor histidine kinase [Winogradskyella arenosi]